ncbi:MAG: ABC transporter ATP-binding protein [Candidatus Sericytochromatia bacterium]
MANVDLRNINKRYGSVEVVKDLSLSIRDGEFLVLVGASGSGKSTTLRMVAGLEVPDSGDIIIGGRRVNAVPPKDRDIAMVFQNYALYPHLDVFDNIAFSLQLRRAPKAEIQTKVQRAAEILGIDQLLKRKPKELSGGQRQRVALARALVRQPQVFLMDEPLSNLDAQLRAHTRVEIKRLHQQIETTIIYVTHDQIEAMTMGDRIAVMKDGRIAQLDSPKEIYEMPADLFVAGFIGSPSMNFLRGTLELGPAGATVRFSDQSITLPLADVGSIAPLAGQPVVLGIRPESLILKHQWRDERVSEIMTEVEVVEPSGSRTFLHLRCEGQPMIAEVDTVATPALKPGSQLPLYVNLAHLHLFDAQTEKNVLATSRAPLAPRT